MENNSIKDYVDSTSDESYLEIENQIRRKKKSVLGLVLIYISLSIISIIVV